MKKTEQIRLIELLLKRLDEGTNVDAGGQRRNRAAGLIPPLSPSGQNS